MKHPLSTPLRIRARMGDSLPPDQMMMLADLLDQHQQIIDAIGAIKAQSDGLHGEFTRHRAKEAA